MNALQAKYRTQGFEILGFPCNNFHYQEPGKESEILNGVKHVRPGNGFVPNFQLFKKLEVNGKNEHPLYTYLKKHCPPTTFEFKPDVLMYDPIRSNDVAWNWETFLIDKRGRVVSRAPPPMEPVLWETDLEAQIALAVDSDPAVGR